MTNDTLNAIEARVKARTDAWEQYRRVEHELVALRGQRLTRDDYEERAGKLRAESGRWSRVAEDAERAVEEAAYDDIAALLAEVKRLRGLLESR